MVGMKGHLLMGLTESKTIYFKTSEPDINAMQPLYGIGAVTPCLYPVLFF